MSIWTNSRIASAPVWPMVRRVAVLMTVGSALAVNAQPGPDAPRRIAVSERGVIIAGPQGYCVDLPAARDTPLSAFVLLGSCAAIALSTGADQPTAPAVLTASVAWGGETPVADQHAALAGFFRSNAGRAALSRSGKPESVRVIEAWASDGVFYLHAQDSSPAGTPAVQPEFWRAVFDVQGRIVTLNVIGLQLRPLGPAAGRATLEAFVRQVLGENRR